MTSNYLDEIRNKRRNNERLTPIEEMIFNYFWFNPSKNREQAEAAASHFERLVKRNMELEIAAAESEKE